MHENEIIILKYASKIMFYDVNIACYHLYRVLMHSVSLGACGVAWHLMGW